MNIPLVDLKKQLVSFKQEMLTKIEEVIDSQSFIQGKYVREFEENYANLLDIPYCAGCSSGTSALSIALSACGIMAGDEVITVPNSFIATSEAIYHIGAIPVFVDIDPDTYNIDYRKIEAVIGLSTRAILPVHLYGNPVEMDKIIALASAYKLKVIEDCAQAHLAVYKGKKTGTYGDAGAFSFFPGKNLGAYGDAGAVVSASQEIWELSKKLLDHGRSEKYLHEMIGYNHRLDALQAAILTVKMRYLKEWTEKRQKNAGLYFKHLQDNKKIKLPVVQNDAEHVFHLFVIQVNNRDEVISYLKSKDIQAAIHYPVPLHLQKAFQYLGYTEGDFPVCESVSQKIISLPLFPELTEPEIIQICSYIHETAK